MGSRKYMDGIVKAFPVEGAKPGIECDSCGMEVASLRGGSVSGATCSWCMSQGPVRGRRAERLARRKGGRVRK